MFLSFFVYTFTALGLFLLARNVSLRESYLIQARGQTLQFCTLEIMLSICLFAFIAGARYETGVDHLTYLREYLNLQTTGVTGRETFESGFLFISKFFAQSGVHFFFYFAFWAALQIGFVYYALRNNKYLLPFVGLCIMLGPYYLSWMNGIRQCVAACAFIYAVEFIEKKKFWHYIIFILLLSFIHRSAIILLPIYFLFYVKWDNLLHRRKTNIIILICCVILGSTPSWLHFVNSLENVLYLLGYEGYADRLEMMTTENLRTMAWGPSRLSIFLSEVLIIWFYPALKDYFKGDRKVEMYFFLFLIGDCLYNLFANTSHIFLRPIEYFTLFRLPLTAYLLYYFYKKKKLFLFFALIVLACSNAYISVYKAIARPTELSDCSLYKFFWDYLY